MKSKFMICSLFTAFLWFAGCSGNDADRVLMKDNPGLIQKGKYLTYAGIPFSGFILEYFENGSLKSKQHFKNGLMEGAATTWYINGSIETRRIYHAGEKEGIHQGWWPNGNPRFEYHFRQGLYQGDFKEWYESGKPLNFFTYQRGKEVRAIGWRENGKTYINFVVRNGKKYGLTNARLCYSLKDEAGIYTSKPIVP